MRSKRHSVFYFAFDKSHTESKTVGVCAKNFAQAIVKLEKTHNLAKVTGVWTGEKIVII